MIYLAIVSLMVMGLLAARALVRRGRSPTTGYELVASLGLGDLSDVHGAIRDRQRFAIKIPRVPLGNDLAAKEYDVLTDLRRQAGETLYAEYLPAAVETFEQEGRRINVFRWREGFRTAEEIRERHPKGLDGRHVSWMFKRTLEVLGFVHRAGWVHGAILPPHLMFHPENHALVLIGWIHAERRNQPLRFVPARFADWYPRECRDHEPVSHTAENYQAAKSMIYLAGGDPVREEIPKTVPAAIRRFLQGCLLESAGMRCHDAWQVHEEFTELLEGVYGPPRYVPMVMT